MKRRKWRGNRIRNGVWEPGYKNPDIQVCIRYSESEVAQSCPTLCDHMDRGAHQASFQARILEKVAISCSRNFPFYISPFTEETERQVSLVYFIWFCQKTIILTINLTLVLYLTWNFLFFFFSQKQWKFISHSSGGWAGRLCIWQRPLPVSHMAVPHQALTCQSTETVLRVCVIRARIPLTRAPSSQFNHPKTS